MTGTVTNSQFGYSFIQTPEGADYFCHASEMPCDEIGRRYLVPGEGVVFEPSTHNGNAVAKNVQLTTARATEDLNGHFEEGAVSKVGPRGEYCFVLRPFGGACFLHWENVQHFFSTTELGRVRFYRGQQWRWQVAPPRGTREGEPWLAVSAVELKDEEIPQ